MKVLQNIIILFLIGFIQLMANNPELRNDVEIIKISAESLKQELDSKHGILLVNVLNKNTYKDCSIQGSLHIPVSRLAHYAQKKVRKGKWSKEQEIVIYCASADCPLSKYAYKILRSLGFTNVKLFREGMRDWRQRGYPCKGKGRAGYLKG